MPFFAAILPALAALGGKAAAVGGTAAATAAKAAPAIASTAAKAGTTAATAAGKAGMMSKLMTGLKGLNYAQFGSSLLGGMGGQPQQQGMMPSDYLGIPSISVAPSAPGQTMMPMPMQPQPGMFSQYMR